MCRYLPSHISVVVSIGMFVSSDRILQISLPIVISIGMFSFFARFNSSIEISSISAQSCLSGIANDKRSYP